MTDDPLKVENVSNSAKWRSRGRPEGYERPGRGYKADRKYRRGKTHTGKGKTLRDHRP
jgi:hypothetical protein